jgi:uncharacterized protein
MASSDLVEFQTADGVTLRGRLFLPEKKDCAAVICLTGVSLAYFGAARQYQLLTQMADSLPSTPLMFGVSARCCRRPALPHCAMTTGSPIPSIIQYKHHHMLIMRSYWGRSDGTPRHDSSFPLNALDASDALTYLSSHPSIDSNRIGVWGGGHGGSFAIALAATDPRIKAVVLNLPVISGSIDASNWPVGLADEIQRDRVAAQHNGGKREVKYVSIFAPDLETARRNPCATLIGSEAAFLLRSKSKTSILDPAGIPWENKVTLTALESQRLFEGWSYLDRIKAATLWIAARHDELTPYAFQVEAWKRATANERRFWTVESENVAAFGDESVVEVMMGECREWFAKHL